MEFLREKFSEGFFNKKSFSGERFFREGLENLNINGIFLNLGRHLVEFFSESEGERGIS